MRALLRRPDGRSTLRVGGLCLDRLTRIVSGSTVGGDGVELSEREAALLGVLMSAPRQIFTRGQLLDCGIRWCRLGAAPSTRMSITCDASSAGASSTRCTAPAIALEPNDAGQ